MMVEDRKVLRVKVQPFFKWFDLWMGVYIDRETKTVYLCLLPTLGLKIHWWTETNIERSFNDGWRQAIEYTEGLIKLGDDPLKALEQTKEIVE